MGLFLSCDCEGSPVSPCGGNREMSLKYSEIHLLSDMLLGMYSQLLFCLHIFLTSPACFLVLFPLQINLGVRCRFVPLASARVTPMTRPARLPSLSSWCHHTSRLHRRETSGSCVPPFLSPVKHCQGPAVPAARYVLCRST